MNEHDDVEFPKHYDIFPGEQAIDLIEKLLTQEELIGYFKANILKYRLRAGKKDNLKQDISKAEWYENRLRQFISR